MKCIVSTLMLAVLVPNLALADGAPRGSDLEEKEALQRFTEGKELFKQQRFEEALAKFKQSCAVSHRNETCPRILGLTEFELGRYAQSATHLRDYLNQPNIPNDDPAIGKIREAYQKAFERSGHIQVEAPIGALIVLDGEEVGRAPVRGPLDVAPGRHRVEARLHETLRVDEVDAGVGTTVKVLVKVDENAVLSSSPATARAEAAASSVPPANAEPRTPAPSASLATPEPSEPPGTPAPDAAFWRPKTVTMITLGTVAAAGLATGIVFTIAANESIDDARALGGSSDCRATSSPTCARRDELKVQGQDQTNWATAGYIIGGASAVGLVASALFWHETPRQNDAAAARNPVRIAPLFLANGGGLILNSDF